MVTRTDLRLTALLLPALLLAPDLAAQAARITVTDARTGVAVAGAMVRIRKRGGNAGARRLYQRPAEHRRVRIPPATATGFASRTPRAGGGACPRWWTVWPCFGAWPALEPLEQALHRSDVVTVEVYRDFGEVPRELQRYAWGDRRCGLVLYRTRLGWRTRAYGF